MSYDPIPGPVRNYRFLIHGHPVFNPDACQRRRANARLSLLEPNGQKTCHWQQSRTARIFWPRFEN